MKVLYITNSARRERPYLDPAVRYRCYNFAEVLEKHGHLVSVIHILDMKMDHIAYFDAIIFHKPPFTKNVEAAVAYAEKLKKTVIADYDDLIFDEKNALESSLFLNGRASKKIAIDIFIRNKKALNLFKIVTVSTQPLREQVEISNPGADVKIIHNGLSTIWVDRARTEILNNPTYGVIGYFSGTSSHNHDWAMVEDTIAEFINKNPKFRLKIVGPLEVNKKKFSHRSLETLKAVEYENLPRLINSCWLNIAPLENNLFNSCKSGLKFFEAGILNTPIIGSPIPDMAKFSESGLILPKSNEEWMSGLEKFIEPEFRHELAKKSYNYSKSNCIADTQLTELLKTYN